WKLDEALGPVRLGGYNVDHLDDELGLLMARPHAMGGDRFYYRGYMERRFGVRNFEESEAKLCALVDQAPKNLIVLAHNGPAGLGEGKKAPFGNDFKPPYGDFGDPDLQAAIAHARGTGRRVLAVVAGHMHHRN